MKALPCPPPHVLKELLAPRPEVARRNRAHDRAYGFDPESPVYLKFWPIGFEPACPHHQEQDARVWQHHRP